MGLFGIRHHCPTCTNHTEAVSGIMPQYELQFCFSLRQRDNNGLLVTEGFAELTANTFLFVDLGQHLEVFPTFGVFQTNTIEWANLHTVVATVA